MIDPQLQNYVIRDGDILRWYVYIPDEIDPDASNFQKDLSTLKSLFQQLLKDDSLKSGPEY